MPVELLNFAKEVLGYYGLLIIVSVYFFYNLPRFFDSINYLSSRKIKSLEDALNSSYLSEFDEKVIKESLSDYYLKKATKLSIDKRAKSNYLDIYYKLSEKFTLLEIERSFQIIDVSVIDFDLNELDFEHKKLKLLNMKNFRMMIFFTIIVYAISLFLWLYFYRSYYLEDIEFKLFGSITMFYAAQSILMVAVFLIMLDSFFKLLRKIKKINTAIDVVVFLQSRCQPNT